MIVEIRRNLAPQGEEVEKIIEGAKAIAGGLKVSRVDLQKSRIFDEGGVRIEIYPNDDRARGVYMCIRGCDDIVVGVVNGGHEHFDGSHYDSHIGDKALAYFKALLHARQVTTDKLKHGEVVSRDTLFKEGDHILSEALDSEVLTTLFSFTTSETYEFSYL